MGIVKKSLEQQRGNSVNGKVDKKPKGGKQNIKRARNGVGKVKVKEQSLKLPAEIQETVRKQKNKKSLLGKGNLEEIATGKLSKSKDQNVTKLPDVGLKSGKKDKIKDSESGKNPHESKEKNFKNNAQVKPTENKKKQSAAVAKTPLLQSLEKKSKNDKRSKKKFQADNSNTENNAKQTSHNNKYIIKPVEEVEQNLSQNDKSGDAINSQNPSEVVGKATTEKEKKLMGEFKPKGKDKSASKENKVSKVVSSEIENKIQEISSSSNPDKTSNKKQKTKQQTEEVPNFDEDSFSNIVKLENIEKIVKALKKQAAEEVEHKKNLIFSDYRYILNVTCFKIPLCPKRIVKLKLKHPLVSEEDDICLIVKDLKRGMRVDYEPTIHHYEDLLRDQGVKGIKTIMPFNQLKKEYGSYEMKIKLANLYDYFLCDGTILGHVVGFLGKTFQKSRCTPYGVRMNTKNMAGEVQKGLRKTSYKQGQKGPMISIPVANHRMSPKQVAENILTVVSQLKTIYPGGLANIRNLYVRVNLSGTSALPLYISMASPPENVPNVIGPRERKLNKLKQEANRILSKFEITSAGEVVRKRSAEKRDAKEDPKNKKKKTSNILARSEPDESGHEQQAAMPEAEGNSGQEVGYEEVDDIEADDSEGDDYEDENDDEEEDDDGDEEDNDEIGDVAESVDDKDDEESEIGDVEESVDENDEDDE